MLKRFRSTRVRVTVVLSFSVLMLLLPSIPVKHSSVSASARPMTGKSIEQFIRDAYTGVGRTPICTAVRNENAVLESLLPSTSSAFKAEVRRFVSTLFETQASYDADPNTSPYFVETTTYSTRNPVATYGHGDTSGFVTDLYHAFLQREPDSGGLAFWIANLNSYSSDAQGRRLVLDAFGGVPDEDVEFTNLVESLYDDGPVCCPVHCPPGKYYDCEFGYCTEL